MQAARRWVVHRTRSSSTQGDARRSNEALAGSDVHAICLDLFIIRDIYFRKRNVAVSDLLGYKDTLEYEERGCTTYSGKGPCVGDRPGVDVHAGRLTRDDGPR